MRFNIYAGLQREFNKPDYIFTGEFPSKEEAEQYAYDVAFEIYESYEGKYGLFSLDDFVEDAVDDRNLISEDDLSPAEREFIYETYVDYVEDSIDYYVVLTEEDNIPEEELDLI